MTRITVAELGRGLGARGDPRELLDHLRAHAARDVRRAAAEDLHAPHLEQLARAAVTRPPRCAVWKPLLEAPAQGAANRVRLLGDLLTHEVRMVALVDRLRAEGHGERCLDRRTAGERRRLVAVGAHHRDLDRRRDARRAACGERARRVGCDEHLAVADAEDHGLPLRATTIESGRSASTTASPYVPVTRRSAPRTDSSSVSPGVAAIRVREHLRVRLRPEAHALGLEAGPELGRVLDDAVVHDRVSARLVAVRMRVRVARLTVCRPARVRDAGARHEASAVAAARGP